MGSSFHRGMHAKTEPRNSNSIHFELEHRLPMKTYMEKQREKAMQVGVSQSFFFFVFFRSFKRK